MDWKDIAKTISTQVPKLGNLLGNIIPGASLVGQGLGGVASLVCGALGIETDDPTPDQVNTALQNNPDAFVKLKEIESTHGIRFEEISLERDRIYLADRAGARSRQVESEKATGKMDINLYVLAWFVVGGFFGLCVFLMFKALPAGSAEVVFMLFGTMATGFGMVLQYFFGSSKSSSDKTALIANVRK